MKIFITLLVMFFSSTVFSIEWDSETLNPVFEGCVENSNIGTDYEYCGCYVNSISKKWSVLEVLQLMESGELESNQDFISIVEDCVYKSQL